MIIIIIISKNVIIRIIRQREKKIRWIKFPKIITKYEYQKKRKHIPPEIRSHATIALGKLCLENELFARQNVELLVIHLHQQIQEEHELYEQQEKENNNK